MVILLTIGAGVVVGGAVALLASRWPAAQAPHVSGQTITKEVTRHPGLAGHLRHHFDPKTETGVALITATAIVGAAAVGIGVLLAMVRAKFGVDSLDVRFARVGAEQATSASTDFMRHVSELGGTRGVILMAVVVCTVEIRRGQARAVIAFMTLVVAGQFALSNGIKYLVERARPDFSQLTGFAGTSFPSGHSTASAATLAAIALLVTRRRSQHTKVLAAGLAAGSAAMVGATRVLLGVHWFSDVVAGLLLGWAWFSLCSIAFGGRLLIFGLPVAAAEAAADREPSLARGDSSAIHPVRAQAIDQLEQPS
jgi:membrane-associated phospholipid phosphatase